MRSATVSDSWDLIEPLRRSATRALTCDFFASFYLSPRVFAIPANLVLFERVIFFFSVMRLALIMKIMRIKPRMAVL